VAGFPLEAGLWLAWLEVDLPLEGDFFLEPLEPDRPLDGDFFPLDADFFPDFDGDFDGDFLPLEPDLPFRPRAEWPLDGDLLCDRFLADESLSFGWFTAAFLVRREVERLLLGERLAIGSSPAETARFLLWWTILPCSCS